MPQRVPPALFKDILDENDLVVVMLEHIDYLLKMEGQKSSFGFAAYSISQAPQPLSSMKGELRRIKGVNKAAEDIILEILETRTSSYLEHLLAR
jgi:DNA polymerase/3'-5' exonuclease PolX